MTQHRPSSPAPGHKEYMHVPFCRSILSTRSTALSDVLTVLRSTLHFKYPCRLAFEGRAGRPLYRRLRAAIRQYPASRGGCGEDARPEGGVRDPAKELRTLGDSREAALTYATLRSTRARARVWWRCCHGCARLLCERACGLRVGYVWACVSVLFACGEPCVAPLPSLTLPGVTPLCPLVQVPWSDFPPQRAFRCAKKETAFPCITKDEFEDDHGEDIWVALDGGVYNVTYVPVCGGRDGQSTLAERHRPARDRAHDIRTPTPGLRSLPRPCFTLFVCLTVSILGCRLWSWFVRAVGGVGGRCPGRDCCRACVVYV